ncbi:SGNH/GDSL hydrolase family protein [Micromonospora sp. C28SCA-DRY-2]|uniref:SGNH/GDSL hydrolase family protein n=1 Tax=Micromonospora sp. C28SCA-DRY-2 TaxID=3059522 RepID=UPI00267528B5|nr:SGNH/GDSL hydrolase family protein [Micromonospora sp. C28SCA-DRY-2]MDO3704981.1 SGNH/GDSL hydrolase family protein [Micromonospora sp. C28SCA-DRY-2]
MWRRYVAIGDSTTEGLDDPDGAGGYRGWADRFALAVARAQGGLEYANLAVRGRTAGRIRAEQLPVALDLAPDLATVVAGMNDVLRPSFDADRVAAEVEAMQHALVGQGATVLTFTLPDPVPVMPVARPLRGRVLALNAALRAATARTGATLVDLGAHPVASDPRLWSDDRLHANSAGHERIAAALAHTVGLPDADDGWSRPLAAAPRRRRHEVVRAELAWTRRHLLPWLGRHLRGRSSGDDRVAKRPVPLPVDLP